MTISGFEYVVPTSVRPGEQVTVVNQDREAHTVTIDGGAIRLSVLPGATAVFPAPAEVGAHTVTCDLHGGMDAVLVVA
jgi:plastocyanin